MSRILFSGLVLFALVAALTNVSRADDCFGISIKYAQIGTAASQSTMSETTSENCIKITVTDRTFTAGFPLTYIMSDKSDGNFTSDIIVLGNNATGDATFCFESDLDPGHSSGCDLVGKTIDKRTEILDLPIKDPAGNYFAYLDSDPNVTGASDAVGLNLKPMPEPGTIALLGSGLLAMAKFLRRP